MAASKDEIRPASIGLNESQNVSKEANLRNEDSDDFTSSSGSSSESDVTDDDDDDENDGHLTDEHSQSSNAKAATINRIANNALTSRLAAFLPRLERANRDLEQNSNVNAQRVDDVGDDAEHYIEMDLSLGVLSEQRHGDGSVKLKDETPEDENDASSDVSSDHKTNGLQSEKLQPAKRRVEEL